MKIDKTVKIKNKKVWNNLYILLNKLKLKYSRNKYFIIRKNTKIIKIGKFLKSGKLIVFKLIRHGIKYSLGLIYAITILSKNYKEHSSGSELFSTNKIYQTNFNKLNKRQFLDSNSYLNGCILNCKGGINFDVTDEEQDRLVKSILTRTAESDIDHVSINKCLKRLSQIGNPLISIFSNQKLCQLLVQLNKPFEPRSINVSGVKKNYIYADAAFSNSEPLSSMEKRVRFKLARKKNFFIEPKTQDKLPSLSPTVLKSQQVPTAEKFTANSRTNLIQNIDIAFDQFQIRMNKIANQYNNEKQKFFLTLFNQCSIDRFESLSTENNLLTIFGVREAETILQTEFEHHCESNSMTRLTDIEYASQQLDGRFRIGLLSNQHNTLNKQFTDFDIKWLVGDKTLQYQADERKRLNYPNPDPISMYEQGQGTGYGIISQKYKHCNPNNVDQPSFPSNVLHVVNSIELSREETQIAKTGLVDGARTALSDKLGIDKESISDQTALQGIIFLNENYTIERID